MRKKKTKTKKLASFRIKSKSHKIKTKNEMKV